MTSWGYRVFDAIDEHSDWSRVLSWDCGMVVDPKWHKKDLLSVTGQRRADSRTMTFFEARFRVRKDGVGLVFRPCGDIGYGDLWSEVIMPSWDREAAMSAILTCTFMNAVPPGLHRESIGMRIRGESDLGRPLSYSELKPLQVKLRRSPLPERGPSLPAFMTEAIGLLEKRHASLSGADVREKIQSLEHPFRFLISRGIPFERIRQAWDEAMVADVMKS